MKLRQKLIGLSSILLAFCAQAATITVDSLDDANAVDGTCSLREAVAAANTNAAVDACGAGNAGADTIAFDASIAGGTITLGGSEIVTSEALTINGGSIGMVIDANYASRIFNVSQPFIMERLTLIHGRSNHGGAIYTAANLIIANSTLSNNATTGSAGRGGAIYAKRNVFTSGSGTANVTLINSTLSGNVAGVGGAISVLLNTSGTANGTANVTLDNSTLSGNSALDYGGVIATTVNASTTSSGAGNIDIRNSTLANNSANTSGGAVYAEASVFGSISTASATVTINSSLLLGNQQGGSLNNCSLISLATVNVSGSADNLLDAACGGIGATAGVTLANTLEPLANNGCVIPAGTGLASTCPHTMALKAGSVAIDAGAAHLLSLDQRGFARVGAPDIGAFEFGSGEKLRIIPAASGVVASHDGRLSCGTACATFYSTATVVDLVATGNDHFTFDAWTGDCSGATPTTSITMNADKTCAATFISQAPIISGIPAAPEPIQRGMATDLADFIVTDADSSQVSVVFTTINGTLTDGSNPITSLSMDTLANINAALVGLQFTADNIGVASVQVEVSDNVNTTTAVYHFSVQNNAGSVAVTGTAKQGEALTAVISDSDGVPSSGITYQWQDENNHIIATQTDVNTYTLSQAEVGTRLKVVVSYTDAAGSTETIASALTAVVDNINDAASVAILGTPEQGETLAAQISDADGLPSSGVVYQWRDENNHVIATHSDINTYTLTQTEVGKQLKVVVLYIDSWGTNEIVESALTATVTNINDAGHVSISGSLRVNETVTAIVTDGDGVPPTSVIYEWRANGVVISGVSGRTLRLRDPQVGQRIQVTATYTDDAGNTESVTSAESDLVRGRSGYLFEDSFEG